MVLKNVTAPLRVAGVAAPSVTAGTTQLSGALALPATPVTVLEAHQLVSWAPLGDPPSSQ